MHKVETSIRVMVRIRPPASNSVYRDETNRGVIWCNLRAFTFDHVFSAQCSDADVFQKVGNDLVYNTIEGQNSCLFVYGQTGTGKTYTMTGNSASPGLVQKSLNLLWSRLSTEPTIQNFAIKATYLQIYNESIRDLMKEPPKDGRNQRDIQIRELTKTGFQVEGLLELVVGKVDDFAEIIKVGAKNRLTKSTKMNESSSRSHSILTVTIESKVKKEDSSIIRVSKLSFVDLAGSEKQKQTQVEGNRLKEAAGINKSLTVLSNVISKLVETKIKNAHVPYRDSVLTKILKDSLGGNSRTIIIGTVSARGEWVAQTISTLIFLERAKRIKNTVTVNQKIEKNQEGLQEKLNLYEETIRKLEELVEKREEELREAKQKETEAREKEQEKQIEIDDLKNLVLNYEKPMDLFEMINVDDNASIFQSANSPLLEYQERTLSTIFEQEDGTIPSSPKKDYDIKSDRINQKYSKGKNTANSIKSVYQSQGTVDGDRVLRMEINFLKEQVGKYFKEENQYNKLFILIERNLENLYFDQAQLQIMEVQCQRLQSLQLHLKECNTQREVLIQQVEQLKLKHKSEVHSMRTFELDKISICSSLQSNEQRMRKELNKLKKMQSELMDRLDHNEQKWRMEIRALNNDNISLRENSEQLEYEVKDAQIEIARLSATLEQQKREEQSMRNSLRGQEEELTNLKQTNVKLENYIEEVLFARICKLETELNLSKEEIKNRDFLVIDLGDQIEFQSSRFKAKEADISALKKKLAQKQKEVQQLKQIIVQLNTTLIISVDGQELTVPMLVERFEANKDIMTKMEDDKKRSEREQQERLREMKGKMDEDEINLKSQRQQLQSLKERTQLREQSFKSELDAKVKKIDQLNEQLKAPQLKQVHHMFDDFDRKTTDLQLFQAQKEVIKYINEQITVLQKDNNHLKGKVNHYKQLYIDLKEKIMEKVKIYEEEFTSVKKEKQKIRKENRRLSKEAIQMKEEIIELKMNQTQPKSKEKERELQIKLEKSEERLSRMNFFNSELKEQIKKLKEEKRQMVIQYQPILGGVYAKDRTNYAESKEKTLAETKYSALDQELNKYRRTHFQKVQQYLSQIDRLHQLLHAHSIKS